MEDPYSGREQTKAKHFILKSYLEALAFKVLNFTDITYVDGFSGPWKSTEAEFKDSSFMIAIAVLMDAISVFIDSSWSIQSFFLITAVSSSSPLKLPTLAIDEDNTSPGASTLKIPDSKLFDI